MRIITNERLPAPIVKETLLVEIDPNNTTRGCHLNMNNMRVSVAWQGKANPLSNIKAQLAYVRRLLALYL